MAALRYIVESTGTFTPGTQTLPPGYAVGTGIQRRDRGVGALDRPCSTAHVAS